MESGDGEREVGRPSRAPRGAGRTRGSWATVKRPKRQICVGYSAVEEVSGGEDGSAARESR